MRGETNGQKEQIVNELVKVHQQYLSRINQTRSLLHTMINYYKNTSKLETQFINTERMLLTLPSDIRSTEVLVRQYETEREKIMQTYEQCRQEASLAENKAIQVCHEYLFFQFYSPDTIFNFFSIRKDYFLNFRY